MDSSVHMILIMRTIFTVLSLFMIRSYPLFLNYKSNTKELFLCSRPTGWKRNCPDYNYRHATRSGNLAWRYIRKRTAKRWHKCISSYPPCSPLDEPL